MNWYLDQTIDLSKPEEGRYVSLNPLLVVGDSNAHIWRVTVLNNGGTYDLTGMTAEGSFIRPDGATVVQTGSVSGNVASVTFPDQACLYAGTLKCIMRVYQTVDSVTSVMAAGAMWCTVQLGETYQIVDPQGIVPSVSNIIAEYAAMETVVSNTEGAIENANAAAATILDHMGSVMRAEWEPNSTYIALEQGGVKTSDGTSTGGTAAPNYCRTGFVPFGVPVLLRFNPANYQTENNTREYRYDIWTYSSNSSSAGYKSPTNKAYITPDAGPTLIANDGTPTYFRIGFRRVEDSTALDATDYANIAAAMEFYQLGDRELTVRGAAADGKATGDAIAAMGVKIDDEVDFLTENFGQETQNLWFDGDVTTNDTGYKTFVLKNPLPAGTYTLSAIIEKTGSTTDANWALANVASTSFGPDAYTASGALGYGERDSATFTTTETSYAARVYSSTSVSASSGLVATWRNIQIESSSTATSYVKPVTAGYELIDDGSGADRTADIFAALASYGECRLGAGTFIVHGLQMPHSTRLTGRGNATVLQLNSSYTSDSAVILNWGCKLDNLKIVGAGGYTWTANGTITDSHGLYMTGPSTSDPTSPMYDVDRKRVTLDALDIAGFSGGAVCLNSISAATQDGVCMTNSNLHHNNVGVYMPHVAEFNKFTNIRATRNYYGTINNGGNNVFENCGFDGNVVQVLMDNSDGTATNNSHGSFVGCTFNHSNRNANNGKAIEIKNMTSGEMFVGCQIFYGSTYLTDCEGVVFSACNYGKGTGVYVSGGRCNVMTGCMFTNVESEPASSPEDHYTWFVISSNDKFVLANCYTRAGTQVTLS